MGLRVILWVVMGPPWVWTLAALWYYDPWPGWVRVAAAVVWAVSTGVGIAFLPRIPVVLVLAAGMVVTRVFWSFMTPSNDRDWAPEHARIPVPDVRGETAHIQNMRYAPLGAEGDAVQWYAQRMNLGALLTADLVAQPFSPFKPISHAAVSFGFRSGDHVVVSVEARLEKGERFNPVTGFFHQYELMYLIGDERDLIGGRTEIDNDPVFVLPLRLTPEEARALFESMLASAAALAETPRFYDPLRDNCTMELLGHLKAVTAADFEGDWRYRVPGYADEMLFEMGYIGTDLSLEDARKKLYINHRTDYVEDGRVWSKQIRGRIKQDEDG